MQAERNASFNGVHYVMTDNMNEDRDIPTYLTVRCGEQLTYQYKELTVSMFQQKR